MSGESFRLGTRGSRLARRQAAVVREGLERNRWTVEEVIVETAGDRLPDDLIHDLGTTGAFVRDLDERVLDGDLDGAVHSLKDMPTEMPDGLVVAAIPERGTPNDVLVTPDGRELTELPAGATVGTASLRRRAQLGAVRPDLDVRPIRGNVDTRLEKLLGPHLRTERESLEDEEEREAWIADRTALERDALDRPSDVRYDALVMAAVGLERIGLLRELPTVRLPLDEFVPAPGQGAIAMTMRDGDEATAVHGRLDHPPSRVAATVERVILAALGGGCIAPIGVHAVVQGEIVHTHAWVGGSDGSATVAITRDLPVERHADAAGEVAADLAGRGATELIAAAASEPTVDPGRS